MQKRDELEALLSKVSDDEFGAIWKNTYGVFPEGSRSELAKEFVAEQYDGELDGCIALAAELKHHLPTRMQRPSNARKDGAMVNDPV